MNNKRFEYLVVDISVTATPAEIENIIDDKTYSKPICPHCKAANLPPCTCENEGA